MTLIPTQMRTIPRTNHQKEVGRTRERITITPAAARIPPIVLFRLFIAPHPLSPVSFYAGTAKNVKMPPPVVERH